MEKQRINVLSSETTGREAAICGKPHIEPCDGIARKGIPHMAMVWGLYIGIKPGLEEVH